MLKDLINEDMDVENLKTKIDPEVLAILAEEKSLESYEESINDLLSITLASKQAKRNNIDKKKLNDIFTHTASKILEETYDFDIIKIYGATGFASSSCRRIHEYILSKKDEILNLVDGDEPQKLISFVSLNLDIFYQIPEMTDTNLRYDGDKLELLKLWISGKNVSEILAEIGDDDPLSTSMFIGNFFGYKAPWGISVFQQIMCKIFDISEITLPTQIKFLPSMIKHGVPLPEASWAIQIGIPSRDMAINLAQEYRSDGGKLDFSNFINWVSKIDTEKMYKEYGLDDSLLDSITRSISQTRNNPYLREQQSLEDVVAKPTWITGIGFKDRRTTALSINKGEKIKILRDYQNSYDRNAVKVVHEGRMLGFLNRESRTIFGTVNGYRYKVNWRCHRCD